MGGFIDFIFGSDDASDAAKDAANTQASAQREALDYLKERERIPQGLREQALTKLGGVYGLSGMQQPNGSSPTDPVQGPISTSGPISPTIPIQESPASPASPVQGQVPDQTRRYAELQAELADLQWKNKNMTEKTRDNQGLHNTSAIEREMREIELSRQGLPQAPYTDPRYPGQPPTDPSTHYNPITPPVQTPQEPNQGLPGFNGDPGGGGAFGQQSLIDQAINSPLYQAMIGGQEMGEEAIMRHSGMTGGLRSGNVQGNMYDYITQLQNQALLSSYNEQLQGLQGMAGLPSNASGIAAGIAGIGRTQAQGITAGAQADATGNQQVMGNLMGIGGLGMQAYGLGMFSDRRLKKNIVKLGKINGFNFYSFDWNLIANALGLNGSTCGCMADEIYNEVPDAVFFKDDFMMVNYSMIEVL